MKDALGKGAVVREDQQPLALPVETPRRVDALPAQPLGQEVHHDGVWKRSETTECPRLARLIA